MPLAPPRLCSKLGCPGRVQGGVCSVCGPKRRTPPSQGGWRSDPRYHTARWQARAKDQLTREPLCAHCLRDGLVMAARVADHVVPHKGNDEAFWNGELQSLCTSHHGTKSAGERGGE